MLNKQKRLFRNSNGFRSEDKKRVDDFRDTCNLAIYEAKKTYLTNIGSKLADPNISQNSYWKLVNRIMNKCKSSKIPPLLVNNIFLYSATDKAKDFVKYFFDTCKLLPTPSVLSDLTF